MLNIRRAAEEIDGTILDPGETFSMNEALGERTTAKGYVPAPMISNGRLVDSVGGGISQLATTLYNAAFFAGFDLVEHTPHSLYIDRYPMGREATVSWGGPELIFRNDKQASLLIKATATDTSITVRFYSSTLGRRRDGYGRAVRTRDTGYARSPTRNASTRETRGRAGRAALTDSPSNTPAASSSTSG